MSITGSQQKLFVIGVNTESRVSSYSAHTKVPVLALKSFITTDSGARAYDHPSFRAFADIIFTIFVEVFAILYSSH
jgi:hypothetical protein